MVKNIVLELKRNEWGEGKQSTVDQTPISYGRWYSAKKISNSSDP
jgi:hypothetical protein